MIYDIYTTLPTDQNYVMQLETNDEITHIVQQVKMILGTVPGDVLGSPTFGVYLEQYLFNLSYDKETIRKKVIEAIAQNIYYDATKYTLDVDVNYGKDYVNGSDYALVDVVVNEKKCMGIIVTQ